MRCRTCGEKAVVNMRQHKLALCKEHFIEWLPQQVDRFIQKYQMFSHQDKILLAVSGGKDSLSLWDILHRLDYQADGIYINLGINNKFNYSNESLALTRKFSIQSQLSLHVIDIEKEYSRSIPQFSDQSPRARGKPCSVCGIIKRHEMNRFATENGYNVLATGHNLDDEAAVLLGNTLNWAGEYLLRQGPVLQEQPGLVRKVKPLCRIYEREMLLYAILKDIHYIYEECPFATGSTSIYYKQLLNRLEHDRPGAKLAFYIAFLKAKKQGIFLDRSELAPTLAPCPRCGQPTSTEGLCSFCRLMEKS